MPPETKVLYEFGRFRCDPREHLLLCEGNPVSLSPKSFEILLALIQGNGRLLTKDELMQQVWPDSFVEEGNLTVNISALRRVLGALPEGQQYIETVPRKGYRFVAPVTELRDDGKAEAQIPAVEERSALPKTVPVSKPVARSRRWWPLAGVLLVSVMVLVLVSSRPAKLTDKDTVVLADFANTTGDPVFDGALRQGLSSQLEQSTNESHRRSL
jgi:DNA-binding winged helix-turn-helix (wHTH) protein